MSTTTRLDPLDVKVALVRLDLPLFRFAALIDVHPVRLGRMLNGRTPIPPAVAERIVRVLAEVRALGEEVPSR